jgi:hypothetical protein
MSSFHKYLSGDIPSTVIALGIIDFPYEAAAHDWIEAEMMFELKKKHIAWWLLRYESDICEIEILVNGNSEPWDCAQFPPDLQIAIKHAAKG